MAGAGRGESRVNVPKSYLQWDTESGRHRPRVVRVSLCGIRNAQHVISWVQNLPAETSQIPGSLFSLALGEARRELSPEFRARSLGTKWSECARRGV